MPLKKLNDQSLHQQLKGLVQQERTLLTRVLEHLCEVERRRLFSEFKRSSLFDYAVHELGYSEDQACRRIRAMRLIKAVPEVREKLSSGALSLTNAAKAQGYFHKASQSGQTKNASPSRSDELCEIPTRRGLCAAESERQTLKNLLQQTE